MRKRYNYEFKLGAVQKVLVARKLGIGENLIYKWEKQFLKRGIGQLK